VRGRSVRGQVGATPGTAQPQPWAAPAGLHRALTPRSALAAAVVPAGASVITTEIEHINVDALEAVQRDLGVDVEPSPASIRIIQDKYAQKVRPGQQPRPPPHPASRSRWRAAAWSQRAGGSATAGVAAWAAAAQSRAVHGCSSATAMDAVLCPRCSSATAMDAVLCPRYGVQVHFQAAGVPLGAFAEVSSEEQLQAAAQKFGFPLMLKTRRWGRLQDRQRPGSERG